MFCFSYAGCLSIQVNLHSKTGSTNGVSFGVGLCVSQVHKLNTFITNYKKTLSLGRKKYIYFFFFIFNHQISACALLLNLICIICIPKMIKSQVTTTLTEHVHCREMLARFEPGLAGWRFRSRILRMFSTRHFTSLWVSGWVLRTLSKSVPPSVWSILQYWGATTREQELHFCKWLEISPQVRRHLFSTWSVKFSLLPYRVKCIGTPLFQNHTTYTHINMNTSYNHITWATTNPSGHINN